MPVLTNSSTNPVISFRGMTKRFPGVLALQSVSLDISSGEIHAIVGENGAGKSTLMKCLAGQITDYEGEIVVHDQVVRFGGVTDAERAGISMIHQELNLVDELSTSANIFLGREKLGRFGLLDHTTMDRMAAELLRQLQCEVDPRQHVGELRVGDRQLIEIAKALSLNADILIMDEPVLGVDIKSLVVIKKLLKKMAQNGTTIIITSHILEILENLADTLGVLHDKTITFYNNLNELTRDQIEEIYLSYINDEINEVIEKIF